MLAYRIEHYLFPAAVLRVRLLQVTNFETYKKAKAAEFHWLSGQELNSRCSPNESSKYCRT